MKFALLAILCALSLWVFVVVRKEKPKPGGYVESSVTSDDVMKAAEFAINAQSEAMQQSEQQPSKLELIKILRAEQQVVAGLNFRLQLSVKQDGDQQRTAEAVVWWQSWRPKPYELTSWTWK